ncbi:MAG: CopD family protein [Elusimicrobia bacterium]|nr:CopD family protein [Elusimicrobiota bacterium]
MAENLFQFTHLLAASIFIGTTIFVGFAMIPALRKTLNDRDRMAFLSALGPRSRILMWVSIALLFGTGLWRAWSLFGTPLMRTNYGSVLKIKIALAVLAAGLMALHDFILGPKMTAGDPGSPKYKSTRRWLIIASQVQLLVILGVLWAAIRLRLYIW